MIWFVKEKSFYQCIRKITTHFCTQSDPHCHIGKMYREVLTYPRDLYQQFNEFINDYSTIEVGQNVNRLLLSCMFSRIIGNAFPLSIYLSQSIYILQDVKHNEQVVGQIYVTKYLGKNRYYINTRCFNIDNEVIISGKAIILQY